MNVVDEIKIYKKYIVKQLKQILKDFLIEKEIKPDFKITKLNKSLVIAKLIEYKYDINNLPERMENTRSKTVKTTIKQYNDEEQEQFLNTGYEVVNPLQAKKDYYNIKTGKNEYVKLLEHQEKFLKKFFLSGVSGSIVFHGVGTGKSLTGAVASHYYLSLNPDGNIVFISPPALILNFVNALKQFGLDEKDRRFSYYTFEKFTRNPNINKDKKTLFIVDEAHLLRTEIKSNVKEDEEGGKSIVVEQNKRGYAILEAIKKTDKCILLTGTPFINKIYDIENLLSMVVKKDPIEPQLFAEMITNKEMRLDYFKYKISHYENNVGSEFFPEKIEEYVPFVMNDDELEKYKAFERGEVGVLTLPDIENIVFQGQLSSNSFTSFYNGTRQYSNLLDYKKIAFIINRIKNKKTTGKFIIYTTFIDNGLRIIRKYLEENDMEYAIISGNQNMKQKEEAKNKYNSGEVNILLITKAGTEGIDTIATEGIFIYEGSSWNEPLVEQAIARAVRFKSHYHLPKEFQKVYIYRLLIIKESDKKIIEMVNDKKIYSFRNELNKIKNIDSEIKKKKANDKKDVKTEEKKDDKTEENKYIDFKQEEYQKLTKIEKEKYLDKIQFNKNKPQNDIKVLFDLLPSVEARLTIISLAKKEQVLEFIKELDNNIQQLEDYETPFEKNISLKKLEKMSDKQILDLQREYIEKEKEDIFKLFASGRMEKIRAEYERKNNIMDLKLDVAKRLQAYFTPEKVIKQMLEYSKKLREYNKLEILEPTAGIGNIPIYLLKNFKGDYKINMIEIDEEYRKVLKEFVSTAPDILNLYNESKNFLRFVNPIQYDLILMNPPFHLKKSKLSYLNRDYYDFDFVKRAFYMLKKGGELIAITAQVNKKEDLDWYNKFNANIINMTVKNWMDTSKKTKEEKQATTIRSLNISIIVLNKTDDLDLREMNMIIDPDLTPLEEKKADDFEAGIGSINDKLKKRRGALTEEELEAMKYDRNRISNKDVKYAIQNIEDDIILPDERELEEMKIIDYFKINDMTTYKTFKKYYPRITLKYLPFF
jgi:predicted RNA methylase